MTDPTPSWEDRLQAAFDWAATASIDPRPGEPSAAQLTYAAAALRQAAGRPEDHARVVRLLEPVARVVADEWPHDAALGLEVLDLLAAARRAADPAGRPADPDGTGRAPR